MKTILLGVIALIFMPLAVAGKPATFATGDGAIRGYDPPKTSRFSNRIRHNTHRSMVVTVPTLSQRELRRVPNPRPGLSSMVSFT
jgi:hypothetical protein